MDGLPLYIQVRNSIREGIEKGIIKPDDDGVLPSQQQFAAHFEVGVATVKRAVKDLEDLGMVMSRRGRGLTLNPALRKSFDEVSGSKQMPHIGVARFGVASPYTRRIMSGAEAFGEEKHAIIHTISLPGLEMEVQEEAFLSSISLVNLDGMLILSAVSSGFIARLVKREIPYVAANVLADRGEVCHVIDWVSENRNVMEAILRRGRKNTLFFAGEESKLSTCLKFFGYKLAMAEHGRSPDFDYIVYEDYNIDRAIEIVAGMLDSGKELDSVLAFDDMMGGAIRDYLVSRGREDILIAGLGNYDGFEDKVTITSDETLHDIGFNSMKTLFDMMNGIKLEKTKFYYDSILIERDK